MSWDYPEPTDEELLEWDISEDGEDPDSHRLHRRQQERWEAFLERNRIGVARAQQYLEAAFEAKERNTPTWWELWRPTDPTALIDRGRIALSTETRYRDYRVGYGDTPRTALESYTMYMDFTPITHHGMVDLTVFRRLAPDGKLTRESLSGNWGWWDPEQDHFRSIVHGLVHSEGRVAVAMRNPPPYGHWMPALFLDRPVAW